MNVKDIINPTLKVKIQNIFNQFEDKKQALNKIFDFLIDSNVLSGNEKLIFDYLMELGYPQEVVTSKHLERSLLKSDNDIHTRSFMQNSNPSVTSAPSFDLEDDCNTPN